MSVDLVQPSPDVILRSSDGKMFYSWKTILSISSPIFNDMLALPQPETLSDVKDGRPVIDLTEDSRTLECILSLCHPSGCNGKRSKVDSVQELQVILEAVTKYEMENLRCVMLEELTNMPLLREDPLRVYALACQYEQHDAARSAAMYTLALPTFPGEYVPELEKINAGKLCRLLLYREKCVEMVHSLADISIWATFNSRMSPLFGCDDDDVVWTTIRCPPSRKYRSGRLERISVHTWWLEYMEKSKSALQRWPHGDVVKDPKLVEDTLEKISSSRCEECKPSEVREAFHFFVDKFSEEVNRRVAEVEIHLDF